MLVPTMVVAECRPEDCWLTWRLRARMPKFRATASTKTMVEWPSEKKNPTPRGRWPSWTSLRVVLSMAAMWSASKAWRMPRVNARTPVPRPKSFVCETWK